jgi:hypothetical protein
MILPELLYTVSDQSPQPKIAHRGILRDRTCPVKSFGFHGKIQRRHFADFETHLAIITALDLYDPQENHISHESLSTIEGLDNVDQLETQFIRWIRKLCDRRDVWDVGLSMGKVLDEICMVEGGST